MKISQAIKELQDIQNFHGDLKIIGGYMADDRPLQSIITIDDGGVDTNTSNDMPVGVYLS